jgi:hypothetical protein
MAFPRAFSCALLLASAATLLSTLGCISSSTSGNEVSGRITIKGRAPNLDGLQIEFFDSAGKLVSAPVGQDGTYKANGLAAGDAKVGFTYVPPRDPDKAPQTRNRLISPVTKTKANNPRPASPIPDALQTASRSQVTCKVESGKPNTFDYDIMP